MIAAPDSTSLGNPPARPLDRSAGGKPQNDSSAEFDVLMAAVHSGFGGRVSAMASTLNHETDLSAGPRDDPHGRRLQQMADRADARAGGGRHSRLDPGPRASETGQGPRGQRLNLVREELGQQGAARTADATGNGKTRTDISAAGRTAMTPSRHSEANPVLSARPTPADVSSGGASPPPKPATADTVTTATAQRDTDVSPERAADSARPFTAVAGPAGVEAARSPARPAPVAQQLAKVLSARAGGVESARAVTGTEQVAAARTAAGESRPAPTGERPGKGTNARPPSARGTGGSAPTQRSAFDRLVRSLRMNAGRQRSTARIQLRPPELGRIRVEARMEGQRLEVFVQTETTAARDLLRSRAADLRAALEQHGIRIDRFEFAPTGQQEQQSPTEAFAGNGDASARHSAFDSGSQQATTEGEPDQVAGDIEHTPADSERETELTPGAAAETRLDVRA